MPFVKTFTVTQDCELVRKSFAIILQEQIAEQEKNGCNKHFELSPSRLELKVNTTAQ